MNNVVNNIKTHKPYQYDTCECDCCSASRNKKQLERLKSQFLESKFGSNWRNVISGMGDQ